jgi:hypothetical protein
MGRYAIITDPLAGTPQVLMVCDTRGEADAILADLRRTVPKSRCMNSRRPDSHPVRLTTPRTQQR